MRDELKRGYIHAYDSSGKIIGLFFDRSSAENFLRRAAYGAYLSKGIIYLSLDQARRIIISNFNVATDFQVRGLFDVEGR